MNKPNTPNTAKPSTASTENDTPPTAPVSRIKQFNPSRDIHDKEVLMDALADVEKLYRALRNGARISRANCDLYGITKNSSVHSLVAGLEATYGLPVDRAWAKFPDGSKVKDYWFSPRTLAALDEPEKLVQIREHFKRHMERRRLDKGYSYVANFLSWVANDPDKFERNPELPEMLSELSRYLTAVVAGTGRKSAGG